MLFISLCVYERWLGTLTLHSAPLCTGHDEQITMLFATLAEAQRTDQLHTALGNRDLIGQATGILMQRHRMTADAAFGYPSQASQDVNMKLTAVAQHLVETGELLGAPYPEQGPTPYSSPSGLAGRLWLCGGTATFTRSAAGAHCLRPGACGG